MNEQLGARTGADQGHTYLLRPGLWSVEGILIDREGHRHLQSGQLVIVHSPELWTIESEMTISGIDPREFLSRYEITPMAQGALQTEWRSESGGPEPVYGLFVIVEDAVLSPWQSRSGNYWGHETLIRVSDDRYQSRGFAYLKRERVMSWAVKLVRQGAPEGGEKAAG
jgi:hypothetical protein